MGKSCQLQPLVRIKNDNLDTMRTATKQKHAEAKALYAENQVSFAAIGVKFVCDAAYLELRNLTREPQKSPF